MQSWLLAATWSSCSEERLSVTAWPGSMEGARTYIAMQLRLASACFHSPRYFCTREHIQRVTLESGLLPFTAKEIQVAKAEAASLVH
jgi:hypothetical protein